MRHMVALRADMRSGETEILGPISSLSRVPCMRIAKFGPTGGHEGALQRLRTKKRRACARHKAALHAADGARTEIVEDDLFAPYVADIARETARQDSAQEIAPPVLSDWDIAFYKGYADPE